MNAPVRLARRWSPEAATLAAVLALPAGALAAPGLPAHLASVVVDAGSGRVLHAWQANRPLYPASLVKLMSAYLVLEAVAADGLEFGDSWAVSATAAGQPPTEARLRAGEAVTVEAALLGMLVPSGNDAAVVAAEALAGSEAAFAARMTATARALGMRHSNFTNASGLPDPAQVSTARDLAVLARALWRRFPAYRDLFGRHSFRHRGRTFHTTNGFLDRYRGAGGMKTGFTCAAGYNLVAIAERDGRRLIGVVLGAATPESRATAMRMLLDRGFAGPAPAPGARFPQGDGSGAATGEATDLDALADAPDQGGDLPLPQANVARVCGEGSVTGAPRVVTAPAGWNVEVGTARSEAAALAIARRFLADSGGTLHGGRSLSLPRPNGVALHRALVTGLSEEQARSACLGFRQRGGDCIVVGPDAARAQFDQIARIRRLRALGSPAARVDG